MPYFLFCVPHSNFLLILILISILIISFSLSFIVLGLAMTLGMKRFTEEEKRSPFECGFIPQSTSRNPFSVHFFLLSIVFLIFDVELILLFPYILRTTNSPYRLVLFLLIIILLIYGALVEWSQKILDWLNFL